MNENPEKQLSDNQLSKLIEAVCLAVTRLKVSRNDMTNREIVIDFANNCGGIKVEFLSRGDGAALRDLTGMATGYDRKSTKRNMTQLKKVLEKEFRLRMKIKPTS
ncbi:hypothetical protein LLQ54_10205 [Rouxiella badensis]|uniref:hypothetical protein n=1 Tax=Rouxiella badensis TaxID=1646377 RepID=UPI001D13D8D7|nr:hypothetical protein [Rouxiella badensis]MCC3740254.1 hypothetical protein [Rouxiella badensis]